MKLKIRYVEETKREAEVKFNAGTKGQVFTLGHERFYLIAARSGGNLEILIFHKDFPFFVQLFKYVRL